ncbi:MAG TPA: dihydrodipicolinate synthase family protein [Candidatus Aquilonibacter sp.]|nr:dihydrodipicolinate synthase family protein [Candidatus Aquilonibacter sp.]
MRLAGAFAPLTTPFAPDGSVALNRLRENIARYNTTRLSGYTINGSTSESVLLTWDEVYQVWEAAREAAAPYKTLIAGAGAEATMETITHTNRAAELGYDVALIRTPSFYKPAISDTMLLEHYLRVADASRIPVMIYSVPVFTHVTVKAPLVARIAEHENIVGMKDSSGDVEEIGNISAATPDDFQLLCGSAATLYESLKRGAVGAIVAAACAFPELFADICELTAAGQDERARAQQQKLIAPAKLLVQCGIAGLKYALDQLGYYGGAPRLPLLPPNEETRRSIDEMVAGVLSKSAA